MLPSPPAYNAKTCSAICSNKVPSSSNVTQRVKPCEISNEGQISLSGIPKQVQLVLAAVANTCCGDERVGESFVGRYALRGITLHALL